MANLSAFIITKNEAHRIEKAIKSVLPIAEEVIVIDSGSTDDTVEIAKKLGARVVFNEWPGYVMQKSFGEKLCKNDWVVNIDADEEFTIDLQNEIAFIFQSDIQDRYRAYDVNFVILHRHDKNPRFLAPSNRFIRIYNRNYCSYSNTKQTTTHDAVTFNDDIITSKGNMHRLNGTAYHRSGTSINQLIEKANFYSGQQALDMKTLRRYPSKLRIAFEMPFCFLKAFFIRRYFVFGFDGFVDSIIFAFARFARLAKAREIGKKESEKQL